MIQVFEYLSIGTSNRSNYKNRALKHGGVADGDDVLIDSTAVLNMILQDEGLAMYLTRKPGMLNRVLAYMPDAKNDIVACIQHNNADKLAVISGLVRNFMTRKRYIYVRKVTAQLLFKVSIKNDDHWPMPNPLPLGADAAAQSTLFGEMPPVFVGSVDQGKSCVVRGGVAKLLKWVVSLPGVAAAVNEMPALTLLVKVCIDAAKLIGSTDVTALSIMIVLAGAGGSSRYVVAESLYQGGDHHAEQAAYLELGPLAEINTLEAEGIEIDDARGRFNLPVKFVYTLDGSGRRSLAGFNSASGLYSIIGVPVTTAQLGDAILRPTDINQLPPKVDLLARTFPSVVCGADTKDNRAKFALRMFGYRLKPLVHYEPDDLKIETLHGFMNVLKHFVAALYAVFVGWKLGHKFQAVLTKHGVAHFVGVGKDGKTETCSITNGVHYAKLLKHEFWRDVYAMLAAEGRAVEGACVRYVGVLTAKLCGVMLSNYTKSNDWLDAAILAIAVGTVLRNMFYAKVISPAVYEFIKVLPEQLRRVRDLELSLHVPQDRAGTVFSVVDIFFNGPFERINYDLVEILRNGSRGGGRRSKKAFAFLGEVLAKMRTKFGNTHGAQYHNLKDAMENQHFKFALGIIMDSEIDVSAKRLKRWAARLKSQYGDLPQTSHFGHPASIASSHAYLLDSTGMKAAPPFLPPVPCAVPVEEPKVQAPAVTSPVRKKSRPDATDGGGDAARRMDDADDSGDDGGAESSTSGGDGDGSDRMSDGDASDDSSDGGESDDDDAPRIEGFDEDSLAAGGTQIVADALTLDTAAQDRDAEGPRGTTTSGKIKSLHSGATEMVLDASFSGKVMVNKKWIRISYRIDGQPLAHQIVLPLRRVAKVYYDAATSLLALVVVKQPTFWIQHQVQVARAPAATDGAPVATAKFAWRETPVDDPSPGKTLSKFQLLRIGSVTKGGFDKLFDHISHLAKR
ncbi:hypothetical protein SO694_00002893, partial [Aureococcus anophagefferens]